MQFKQWLERREQTRKRFGVEYGIYFNPNPEELHQVLSQEMQITNARNGDNLIKPTHREIARGILTTDDDVWIWPFEGNDHVEVATNLGINIALTFYAWLRNDKMVLADGEMRIGSKDVNELMTHANICKMLGERCDGIKKNMSARRSPWEVAVMMAPKKIKVEPGTNQRLPWVGYESIVN